MGAEAIASESQPLSERLFNLLDRVDYRLVANDADKEAVFRLRYEAYRRENLIEPMFGRRLSDHFDELENTFIFALDVDGEMAATIRLSIGTSDYPDMPAMEVFRDRLEPALEAGMVIVDPTRHATSEAVSHAYPGLLPYMTTRIPWMVGQSINADAILATVRTRHRAFYRRTFECRAVGEPGYYPALTGEHYLMVCDLPEVRERVQRRNPIFNSSRFERQALLGMTETAASIVTSEHTPIARNGQTPLDAIALATA